MLNEGAKITLFGLLQTIERFIFTADGRRLTAGGNGFTDEKNEITTDRNQVYYWRKLVH